MQEKALTEELEKQKVTSLVNVQKPTDKLYKDNQTHGEKPFWTVSNPSDQEIGALNESLLSLMATLQLKDIRMLKGDEPEKSHMGK